MEVMLMIGFLVSKRGKLILAVALSLGGSALILLGPQMLDVIKWTPLLVQALIGAGFLAAASIVMGDAMGLSLRDIFRGAFFIASAVSFVLTVSYFNMENKVIFLVILVFPEVVIFVVSGMAIWKSIKPYEHQ